MDCSLRLGGGLLNGSGALKVQALGRHLRVGWGKFVEHTSFMVEVGSTEKF